MDRTRANVRHLIGDRPLSEVGAASGVTQSWLQRYMNPDKPSGIQKMNPDKLLKLAKYFGVHPADILGADLSGAPKAVAASQSEGLDVARLTLLIECFEGALLDARRQLDPSRKARILGLMYADQGIPNTREAFEAALRGVFMAME